MLLLKRAPAGHAFGARLRSARQRASGPCHLNLRFRAIVPGQFEARRQGDPGWSLRSRNKEMARHNGSLRAGRRRARLRRCRSAPTRRGQASRCALHPGRRRPG